MLVVTDIAENFREFMIADYMERAANPFQVVVQGRFTTRF
jgi:hypothetical protein